MDIQTAFKIGMKRDIPYLLPMLPPSLNIGAGAQQIDGVEHKINDKIDWDADSGLQTKFTDCMFASIHCHHVLEHLRRPLGLFLEIERLLIPGGVALFTVPWFGCSMAFQDFDHKRYYDIEAFHLLFTNKHYQISSNPSTMDRLKKMRLHTSFLIGIESRNIAIVAQVIKSE